MGIQNVKKLRIRRDATYSGLLNNLVHLHQLETLSLTYCLRPLLPSSAKAFPATLKKLKLERTFLRWSYWDIIAELPNLAVLKLIFLACRGEEWHPNVKGFARLKLLLIEDNDVKYWKATNDNFPVIERLVLKECRHLKEIPIEFAEIHTLQLIELNWCLSELGGSATRIQKEQEDLGNNPLDVRISHPLTIPSANRFTKLVVPAHFPTNVGLLSTLTPPFRLNWHWRMDREPKTGMDLTLKPCQECTLGLTQSQKLAHHLSLQLCLNDLLILLTPKLGL
ncbi:hypothetical protein T459_24436 [Capsicum annuum]|uniref:Late blight resistance protein homolog R1A-3 n=1 Tax=Capsicum annuum TaxID=4072 RepID=A0A2G2YVJ1_CAPAN|nr:hypothetical protein T459_24436 [Capsicum annuum]